MTPEKEIINIAEALCDKFIKKVESGRAISKETYVECKHLKEKIMEYKNTEEI